MQDVDIWDIPFGDRTRGRANSAHLGCLLARGIISATINEAEV